MEQLDQVRLHFSEEQLLLLNICVGFIMFGIALGLTSADFRRLLKMPLLVLAGFLSQFLVLPLLTFIFIYLVEPSPSIALGMMLVAACPGGNISNFITALAKGNTALSVTLTAIASTAALILTPFNFNFWGGLYPPTASLLQAFQLNTLDILQTIILILAIPLVFGMWFRQAFEPIALRMIQPIRQLSMVFFLGFVVMAFYVNFDIFIQYIHLVFLLVIVHNGLALFSGYSLGTLFGFELADRKALTIETGIQNSGIALSIIFTYFDGLGGMALVTGWWAIWHMVGGFIVAYVWSKRA